MLILQVFNFFTFAPFFLTQNRAREKKSDANNNLESNTAVHKENNGKQQHSKVHMIP